MTPKQKILNSLTWGFILWFVGYLAGILLFFIVPKDLIGWVIAPFAILFTIWVIVYKVKRPSLSCYVGLGIIWTVMAVVLDYIFLVKMFNIGTSYYKPDVFLYYIMTLFLPIGVGYWKYTHKTKNQTLF